MAEYALFYKKFWTNPKMQGLSEDARLLWIYLFTSPHSNMIGCYTISKLYILSDLQWLPERLTLPFGELLSKGLIEYDDKCNVLLIPSWFKHNNNKWNINQLKKAHAEVSELPKTYLLQRLKSLTLGLHEGLTEGLGLGLPEGLPLGSRSVSVSESVTETKYKYNIADENSEAEIDNPEIPSATPDFNKLNKTKIDEVIYALNKHWPNSKIDSVTYGGINKLISAGFGTYDAIICAIAANDPPKNAYAYLMGIAQDPESAEIYAKMAESKPISQINGLKIGGLLKDANAKTTSG